MSLNLYVEGGGDSKALRRACARGFPRFLEKGGLAGRLPRIVACGGRQSAYGRFCITHNAGGNMSLLLVDAEGPVMDASSWQHLCDRDGWTRPAGATDDQCHLMVEVMESWFLADKIALISFYGQGFHGNALPGNLRAEDVPKADVFSGLNQATRSTQKGAYRKGAGSFDILARIDPGAVEAVAPHARRFLDTLRSLA